MRIIGLASELPLQGHRTRPGTRRRQCLRLTRSSRSGEAVELRSPFRESPVAVCNWSETQRRHVVFNAHRQFQGSNKCRTDRSPRGQSSFSRMRSPLRNRENRARSRSCPTVRHSQFGFPRSPDAEAGRPLKSRTRSPDAVGTAVDDARNVDAGHVALFLPSLLLRSRALYPDDPPPPPSGGFFGCGFLTDALHVARLADEARHAREAAAFDADLRRGSDRSSAPARGSAAPTGSASVR